MANRTTRKQVESMFDRFVHSIGGRVATSYNDVGGYRLDYNSVYGGYVIERVAGETGGVSRPFGDSRRMAAEMWYTMHFAINVLREVEKK